MNGTPKGRQAPRDTLIAVNGYAIREIRKLVGITTAQFAREVSLERSYLSRIENGQKYRVNRSHGHAVHEDLALLERLQRVHGLDQRRLSRA